MISLGTERYAAILTIGGLIEKLFSQRCGARNRNRNNEWRLIECLCQRYKCQEECERKKTEPAQRTVRCLQEIFRQWTRICPGPPPRRDQGKIL